MTARSPLASSALAVALLSCSGGAEPAGERVAPADLVVLGSLMTVDPARPAAEGLAARGGRIVALGTRADLEGLIGPETEVLELAPGQMAMPGFIEGHGHFLGLGDSRLQLDLRSAASWDEIVDTVAAAVQTAKPGEWIRGRGWHQEKWRAPPEPAVEGFPVHAGLSAVSPDNPVLLVHASGHGSFVNAKAMELAGIGPGTPDPPGGEILRDAAGRATGFLRELATDAVRQVVQLEGEDLDRRRIELASRECLAKGVTSFHDAGSSFATVERLKAAAEDGTLGVRLWVMVRPNDVTQLGGQTAEADDAREQLRNGLSAAKVRGHAGGMLSVGGIKVTLDGALGSRGAWLLEPYSDAPPSTGLPSTTIEALAEVASIAAAHEMQLCVHAIGDRANREALDVYEATFRARPQPSDRRWRIEHAQHLHPDDVPRFGALGVVASIQAVHCTSDGPWVPERLGAARSESGAYVWRTLLDRRAVLVNGTDVPVEDVDPIANFHAAVTRQMGNGERFYPAQAMTREEAIVAATRAAAWSVFEEGEKGTLAVGKLADLVVLSQDLMAVPEEQILETRVVTTVVGGRIVHRAE